MVTDFKTLVSLCEDELNSREYAAIHHSRISAEWENLDRWIESHNYTNFTEAIGFQYCDETLGTHIITDRLTHSEQQSKNHRDKNTACHLANRYADCIKNNLPYIWHCEQCLKIT
jgi:hypothetical protein